MGQPRFKPGSTPLQPRVNPKVFPNPSRSGGIPYEMGALGPAMTNFPTFITTWVSIELIVILPVRPELVKQIFLYILEAGSLLRCAIYICR